MDEKVKRATSTVVEMDNCRLAPGEKPTTYYVTSKWDQKTILLNIHALIELAVWVDQHRGALLDEVLETRLKLTSGGFTEPGQDDNENRH